MKYSSSLRKQQSKPKIVQDINDVHEKYIIQVRILLEILIFGWIINLTIIVLG